MIKILSTFILTVSALVSDAQNDIGEYLKTHHYSFSIDKGFDRSATDTLKQKLNGYKLILQAEGGSHSLALYKKLPLVWIEFLHSNFGLTHFFLESGQSSAVLMNKYFQTGDTSYCYAYDKTFWNGIYSYNFSLPPDKKLKYFGIDFERANTYVRALKSLLPFSPPPDAISADIELIKSANDSLRDCDYIIKINQRLRTDLLKNKQKFTQYFAANYFDFERIVLNRGDCNDVYKDRNKHMASAFLSFDETFDQSMYYGELGEAHTVLKNRNTASILTGSGKFEGKLCVINLYCYRCGDKAEVSNWPLAKIEKDIEGYFLPYCETDLTLFDLSGNSELVKKYSAYGQFLIIAKNQGQ